MLDLFTPFIFRHYRLTTFCLLVGITVLSLLPLEELPAVPGSDKTHHLLAYGALILPLALRQPKGWLWMVAVFLLWGGGIELLQPLVNRYAEWSDLAANGAGLLLGCALGMAVKSISRESC